MAIRSRDPFRALVVSLALFLLGGLLSPRKFTADLDRVAARLRRYAPAVAAAAAAALAAHALAFGSFAVGGADSYGYVNQAYDWASGRLPRPIPLPLQLPFATADYMQAPLGYRVGAAPHTMVPIYAPGLPLFMAVSLLAGKCGPFLVVPFFAMVFVWMTFRLATIAGGRSAGIAAVAVLITSPVVLYQALWPMSDVPAGALWTAALACSLGPSRRSSAASGMWAAAGLLVRPNLLFVPAAPLLMVVSGATGTERWRRAALFCAPIVAAAVFIAAVNTTWYGAPSNSGYGAPGELYQARNVWPNVRLYTSWLWQSQRWGPLLALLPLVPSLRRGFAARAIGGCALMCVLTFTAYVSYAQFDLWWYLRFLLPAFGCLAALMAVGLVAVARTVPRPFGRVAAVAMLYLMMATAISFAADKQVFGRLRAGERRYVDIGEFAGERLPSNAVLFASQHSGSLRFYSGRLTLRFDWIEKEWAPGVAAAVERAGYHPYLIVDDFEIPQVRVHFGLPEGSRLPWPVVARRSEVGGITVYDMATAPQATRPIALDPGSRECCAARKGVF